MVLVKKTYGPNGEDGYDLFDSETGELSSSEQPCRIMGNGGWVWFLNDMCHREDGPAMYLPTKYGFVRYYYYIEGEEISRELFVMRYEMIYLKEYTGI